MRIILFLATNFAILLVAGLVMSLLGVGQYLQPTGLDLRQLLIFCAVFGFAGAFVSLWLSKWSAKMGTRTQIIETPRNDTECWLVETVRELAQQKGLGMPEVGIFPGAPNAFATGANRNRALVAVSSSMLQQFPREEVRAVMAHEIGHVANGDMVTLTLIQGVVNTFVLFFARIIGWAVDRLVFRNQHGLGMGYWMTTIIAQIFLAILASFIVAWFSRRREFRADAVGAQLAGAPAMIGALERLRGDPGRQAEELPDEMVAFGINPRRRSPGWVARLGSTHPPLEKRIAALRNMR